MLVWLLKRFLYRPILDGIDGREAEIAERMQVAVRAKKEAQATEANYRAELATLHSEQASLSDTARQKAEQERDTLLAEAHDRIERERTAWQAHLDAEARSFTNRMHHAGGHALLELTRKALHDLADETLEARMAESLVRQLASMDGDLQLAAGHMETALVTSHAELPKSVQYDLTKELVALFAGTQVRFETDETHAPGLSLQLGGAHLEWTIDTYIDGLDGLIADQIATGADMRASPT